MPNDAKLGLVVGVGLIIAAAVFCFRREATPGSPAANAVKPVPAAGGVSPPSQRPALAKATGRTADPSPDGGRRHTVKEGETLVRLALEYYGDGEKSAAIYEVNRDVLSSPDEL